MLALTLVTGVVAAVIGTAGGLVATTAILLTNAGVVFGSAMTNAICSYLEY